MPHFPRCRLSRCQLCFPLGLLFLGSLLVLYKYLYSITLCTTEESKTIIHKLCADYHDTLVSGNLCPDLCMLHNMRYIQCLNYRGGKQVFLVEHRNRRIIMKSKMANIRDANPIYYIDEATGQMVYPSLANFITMASNSAEFDLQVDLPLNGQDLVRRLWPVDIVEYIELSESDALKHAAMQSLWSLLQQDEYLILLYMYLFGHETHLFPKMYGSCGQFYFLENAPPGALDITVGRLIGLKEEPSWVHQAALALSLLDLLKDLKTGFKEELHLCDIKGMNFGINGNGSLKVIDVDSVFFETKMRSEMQSGNLHRCKAHTDCDFFDCQGWCNLKTQQCVSLRINDNFQVTCQKIFQSHSSNAFIGLLTAAPSAIAGQLQALLDKCANPSPSAGLELPGCSLARDGRLLCQDASPTEDRRFRANWEDVRQLYELLRQSLALSNS